MLYAVFLPNIFLFFASWSGAYGESIINHEDLLLTMENFTRDDVISFTQLVFDIPRYQLLVGARDYLYRLSLEGLRVLEETYWPAKQATINTCRQKGQTEEDCHNFVRVLLVQNNRVFTCGTNAFSPECSWRDINTLGYVFGWENGVAKCPYSPDTNVTALFTKQGDYYIASALDFSAKDHAVCRMMGNEPFLRTVQYDPKWLNEPNFIAAYEIGNFTYFFFRETAVEYINCGKVIYSRVARICKNDQGGGQYMLKDNWTTFLKARLNCSTPGSYPFYFNEIQGVHYVEGEEVIYATFTTPENSIYGTAVCAFNLSAIYKAFTGPLKYSSSPKSAWEKKKMNHDHFQCQTPGSTQFLLDAEYYQLTDEAVQPMHSTPIYVKELERFGLIVADVVPTKYHKEVHVLFVATFDGRILKLVVFPNSGESCLVEDMHIFPKNSKQKIKVLKILKSSSSLYVGTDSSVLRIPLHRCNRFRSKMECINSLDPYCGWNEHHVACTTAPYRNPMSSQWNQESIQCPKAMHPVDGGWSHWSSWFPCLKYQSNTPDDICWCQKRECNKPHPGNGGRECEGIAVQVANCTRNGQWTEWSLWSPCSQTCGPAFRFRHRTCSNPSPAYGGLECEGIDHENENCIHNPRCPDLGTYAIDAHWSEWGSWTHCTVPCGGGFQSRERKCNEVFSSYRNKQCLGCSKEFRVCNMHLCSEVRKSTSWTPWFRLDTTKDGYFEQRFRTTCRANIPDAIMIRASQVKKERFCPEGSQSCADSASFSTGAEWSSWSDWSSCSAICGKGSQYRERTCDIPPLSDGSLDCSGDPRIERECELQPCNELSGWEMWTTWSFCDNNGKQYRERKCKFGILGSGYCEGSAMESRICMNSDAVTTSPDASHVSNEDGVHMEHIIIALFGGLFIGIGFGAFAMYFSKQRKIHDLPGLKPRGTDTNLYVSSSEWKSRPIREPSAKMLPQKEATIKRNCGGSLTRNLRTPLYSEDGF